MKRRRWFVGILLVMACHSRSAPERAVEAFVDASIRGDCDGAWNMLSSATRQAFDNVSQRSPGRPASELACSRAPYDKWKMRTMRVANTGGNRVSIIVKRGEPAGFLIPGGFFPTRVDEIDDRIDAVLEDGVWHVEVPGVVEMEQARQRAMQRERDAIERERARRR